MVLFYRDNRNAKPATEKMWMLKSDKSFIIKLLKTLLKFGAAALVIYLLFRGDTERIKSVLQTFNYLWLLPALFFTIIPTLITAWRWQTLAGVQGIKMHFAEAYSLTMQGYFFSLVIPGGAIGGDVIKMGATSYRLPEGRKTEGAFSVLMDRIVGMLALFTLTLILLFPARGMFFALATPDLPEKLTGALLFWLCAGVCICGLGAGTALFFHRKWEKLPGFRTLLRSADKHSKGLISRLMASADRYNDNKKIIFLLVMISMAAVHIFSSLPIIFLLVGSGANFNIPEAVTALTVGNIAGLIPIFPGGVGSRDVVAIALLSASGVSGADADASQILYTALMILTYLSGGLFFIFDPARKLDCIEVKK